MKKSIKELSPKVVWTHFDSLTQIPRPSKHEDKIQKFMLDFGKGLGLETIRDEVGNIIIRKPATKGMENKKGVILQAHLDMVPQKNSDKQHNFETDPIETIIDGEWVTANGTTLGADNGMGVAAAMAVLSSKDIEHGPIEALFTCDEETGMTGAFGLKPGLLKGDILLNLDSEDEGELYVGCAGGTDATSTIPYNEKNLDADKYATYLLTLKGLKGGHSGMEIILQRGNSNKLLNRFLLDNIDKFDIKVVSINGGGLRNAIPRESFVTVAVCKNKTADFEKAVSEYEKMFKSELASVEPDLEFYCEKADAADKYIDEEVIAKLVKAVSACPNGVIRMSDDMEGLVETSSNLASVKSGDGKIVVQCLLRSSVDTAKEELGNRIKSVFELAGADVVLDGSYPGWKPNMDSPILSTMQNTYKKLYGKTPEIKAIHAGLECGLLGGVYPNWDMISFGPTIRFPHSPDEKVSIPSVEKFWEFLLATLKNIPNK